jgi:hypothetical protein
VSSPEVLSYRAQRLFGAGCVLEAPLSNGFAARLSGLQLSADLSPMQAELLLDIWRAFKVSSPGR